MKPRREREPTPEEIRAATSARPHIVPSRLDDEDTRAFFRVLARRDPPDRIVELDGEPLPDYDTGA